MKKKIWFFSLVGLILVLGGCVYRSSKAFAGSHNGEGLSYVFEVNIKKKTTAWSPLIVAGFDGRAAIPISENEKVLCYVKNLAGECLTVQTSARLLGGAMEKRRVSVNLPLNDGDEGLAFKGSWSDFMRLCSSIYINNDNGDMHFLFKIVFEHQIKPGVDFKIKFFSEDAL